ncbi:MAG: hypothetical protein WB985_07085 [Candidatus Acidiferrales bacterium]
MLARNEVALFDGALLCKTPQAFQEKLLAFPTAQPANCITMSCHLTFSFIHLGDQFTGWRPFFLIQFTYSAAVLYRPPEGERYKIGRK